ncbi:MAG TPA: hypothetical protein EYG92_12300 [Lutibacter sp.]|nr:hypothetical protein [Lutibacter sp.]
MNDSNKTISVFSGGVVEVQKLQNDLEAIGIKVIIKNFDATAANVGFANISRASMQLSILKTDVEKARPIIVKFKEQFGL